MILEFSEIANAGDLDKERIVLKALKNGPLGEYAIFRAHKKDDSVASGDVPDAYWFADREVSAGDLVVLYTKTGVSSQKELKLGATTYFYYWHQTKSLWGDQEKYRAVLVNTDNWSVFEGKPPKS